MSMQKPDAGADFAASISDPLQPVASVTPHDWQMGLPDSASPVMGGLTDLHRLVTFVALAVFAVLVAELIWVMIRYRRRAHPVALKSDRQPFLQAASIGIPAIVLVFVAIPALRLLYVSAHIPEADVTVEVVGKAGAWVYEYPKDGKFRFLSEGLDRDRARAQGMPYPFAASNPLTVPAGRKVVALVTSADELYSWSVPALGVRADAVPGRIHRVWFVAEKPGIYYGLSSGARRAAMPVAVKVVPDAEYRGWLSWALLRGGSAAPGSYAAEAAGGNK